MKAVVLRKFGEADVLETTTLPDPAVPAGSVRVRVKAVALNHLDVWVRKGVAAPKLALPHVLGSDVAGVVDAVGAEVKGLEVGTPVVLNPGLSCGHCEKCLSGE